MDADENTVPTWSDALSNLMGMADTFQPFVEFAEGQRDWMMSRGWSPEYAESYAFELLMWCLRLCLKV